MSLKPPKKSDLEKTWMQARLERTIKISPEYHLIVTEGTKTEPPYFEAIQRTINEQYRGRIQLDVSGEGTNTVFLFDRAKYLAGCSPNTIQMIFQKTGSMKSSSFAGCTLQRKRNIMRSGLTSALNCGIYSISAICTLIFTGVRIGLN